MVSHSFPKFYRSHDCLRILLGKLLRTSRGFASLISVAKQGCLLIIFQFNCWLFLALCLHCMPCSCLFCSPRCQVLAVISCQCCRALHCLRSWKADFVLNANLHKTGLILLSTTPYLLPGTCSDGAGGKGGCFVWSLLIMKQISSAIFANWP